MKFRALNLIKKTMIFGERDKGYEIELQKIQGRRERSRDRIETILDSKKRTIGIDLQALNLQKNERLRRLQIEKEQEDNLFESLMSTLAILTEIDRRRYLEKQLENSLLCQTWDEQAKKYLFRGAWDKNEKLQLDREINDPRRYCAYNLSQDADFCIEEDVIGLKTRIRELQEEEKRMLDLQISEQMRINEAENETERLRFKNEMDNLRMANESAKKQWLVDFQKSVERRIFNSLLAEELRRKERENKELGWKLDEEHMKKMLSLDLITEPMHNGGGFLRTTYKRLSPDEELRVRQFQLQQINEINDRIRNEELNEEERVKEEFRLLQLRNAIYRQQMLDHLKTEMNRTWMNLKLAMMDKEKRDLEWKYRLQPGIQDDWWPFGKTDR